MKWSSVGIPIAATSALLLTSCTPSDVQRSAIETCKYAPAIPAIIAIADIFAPGVGTLAGVAVGQQVVKVVCDAVEKSKAKKGFASPGSITAIVSGPGGTKAIRLNGQFVR